MPSNDHESLITLTRNRPEFIEELLRAALGYAETPRGRPRVLSADLTTTPTEYRADQVVVFTEQQPRGRATEPTTDSPPAARDDGSDPRSQAPERNVAALVVEVQRSQDPDKRFSWPAYVVLTRARHRCPTELLVLCTHPNVARWAAEPVPIGPEGFDLRPNVIGPHNTPYVVDPAQAARSPEMSTLSVIMHGQEKDRREPVFAAMLGGLDATAGRGKGALAKRHQGYIESAWTSLQDDGRQLMETLMLDTRYGYNGPFSRRFAEGVAEGKAEGLVEGEARSVLRILETRNIDVPEDIREQILSCADQHTLDTWLRRAITAITAKDLFDRTTASQSTSLRSAPPSRPESTLPD